MPYFENQILTLESLISSNEATSSSDPDPADPTPMWISHHEQHIILLSKGLTNHVVYNSSLSMLEIRNVIHSIPNGIVESFVKNGLNIPQPVTVCIVLHVECLVL